MAKQGRKPRKLARKPASPKAKKGKPPPAKKAGKRERKPLVPPPPPMGIVF